MRDIWYVRYRIYLMYNNFIIFRSHPMVKENRFVKANGAAIELSSNWDLISEDLKSHINDMSLHSLYGIEERLSSCADNTDLHPGKLMDKIIKSYKYGTINTDISSDGKEVKFILDGTMKFKLVVTDTHSLGFHFPMDEQGPSVQDCLNRNKLANFIKKNKVYTASALKHIVLGNIMDSFECTECDHSVECINPILSSMVIVLRTMEDFYDSVISDIKEESLPIHNDFLKTIMDIYGTTDVLFNIGVKSIRVVVASEGRLVFGIRDDGGVDYNFINTKGDVERKHFENKVLSRYIKENFVYVTKSLDSLIYEALSTDIIISEGYVSPKFAIHSNSIHGIKSFGKTPYVNAKKDVEDPTITEYSCKCGKVKGRMNDEVLCHSCHTQVCVRNEVKSKKLKHVDMVKDFSDVLVELKPLMEKTFANISDDEAVEKESKNNCKGCVKDVCIIRVWNDS